MTQTPPNDLKIELASFESTAFNFGARFIPDSQVRVEYNFRAKQLSAEIRRMVETRKITPVEGARRASEMRNALMDAMRGRSSEIGRAYAIASKATGKTLPQLQEVYAARLFGKQFPSLAANQQNAVWKEIVFAAGRPRIRANQLARIFGIVGRSFIALTITISVYNIVTAENKSTALANEGAVVGGGLLGSVAGGAVAGLACGPGSPICVTIGIFVGGVMFAIGAQVAFDSFWW